MPNNDRGSRASRLRRPYCVFASITAIAGTVLAPLSAAPVQHPITTQPSPSPDAVAADLHETLDADRPADAVTADRPAAIDAVTAVRPAAAHPAAPAGAVSVPAILGASALCSHTAAVQMAAQINAVRRTVKLSRHALRVLHHEQAVAAHEALVQQRIAAHRAAVQQRIAQHQANVKRREVRIAMQDKAIHSGNVVEAAVSLRGSRYVMGGTSRSGFDCSGFVRYILSNTGGVALPRTAEEQYYHGAPIDPKDMQPGDLVFFKNTYKRGISHVGIYIGNGKFVHAANSHKGVREDYLSTPYYAHHFAGARRVLPEDMRRIAAGH